MQLYFSIENKKYIIFFSFWLIFSIFFFFLCYRNCCSHAWSCDGCCSCWEVGCPLPWHLWPVSSKYSSIHPSKPFKSQNHFSQIRTLNKNPPELRRMLIFCWLNHNFTCKQNGVRIMKSEYLCNSVLAFLPSWCVIEQIIYLVTREIKPNSLL